VPLLLVDSAFPKISRKPLGQGSEIPMLSIIVIIDHYYVAWAPTLNLNSTVR
jgi:hypothetical protein